MFTERVRRQRLPRPVQALRHVDSRACCGGRSRSLRRFLKLQVRRRADLHVAGPVFVRHEVRRVGEELHGTAAQRELVAASMRVAGAGSLRGAAALAVAWAELWLAEVVAAITVVASAGALRGAGRGVAAVAGDVGASRTRRRWGWGRAAARDLFACAVPAAVRGSVPTADVDDGEGAVAQRDWGGVVRPGRHGHVDELVRPRHSVGHAVLDAAVLRPPGHQ